MMGSTTGTWYNCTSTTDASNTATNTGTPLLELVLASTSSGTNSSSTAVGSICRICGFGTCGLLGFPEDRFGDYDSLLVLYYT
jgi:hypothetical protein